MKVAVYYDWLNQWGGAERVLLNILKIYPQADLFTLVHDPAKTSWLPKNIKVNTSIINSFPFSKYNPIFYTPLYAIALEQFDFSQYDILISTTSNIGHCLLTLPKTLFICYYHNVNRYLYLPTGQFEILKPITNLYQKIDKLFSFRPDFYFCNSSTVQSRITKYLNHDSKVINPGVDTNFFIPASNPSRNYFLVISRLVPHKRVDIAISACQNSKQKLIIVGSGRQTNYLKAIADPKYIEFTGNISDKSLRTLYQNAKALICPQTEDYGLTPLESMSCGTPVIALNSGGITETVVNKVTGLFFENQSAESLQNCISLFNNTDFSYSKIRTHAQNFSETKFMLNFKKEVDKLWKKHLTI